MQTIKELERLFIKGLISRREFITRLPEMDPGLRSF
jgi:hypothetical protein